MDDVTPELIEQVDFSDKFRGYDPDEVDTFLERVGETLVSMSAKLTDLSARAQRAEAEVVRLREQPPAATAPAELTDDEEIAQATRTLTLAKRTAEAAISEAREEAAKLVEDARSRAETEVSDATTEADRILVAANEQRDELLRVAKEDADREASAQRDRLLAEVAGLDGRKAELAGEVTRIEAHLAEYRRGLEGVHGTIAAVLDDPSALRAQVLDVNLEPTSSAFYYTGSNPIVSEAETVPLAPGLSDAEVEAEPEAEPEPITPDLVQPAVGDPWAPGSWSEVFEEEAAADVREVFEPSQPDLGGVRRADLDGGEPTQAYQAADDPYLRDLDRAVNRPEPGDPAMEAFFDDGSARVDSGSRGRFRRR